MTRARRYFEWQYRWAKRELGRRVLEVGCGLGNFTRCLLDRDCVVGIDVEPTCVSIHKETFAGNPNVHSFHLDVLDDRVLGLKSYDLDSIVCLNVLEHVSDDRKALQRMHALLPEGGKAVLILPAFESLFGPIDRNLGHYRRYSKRRWLALAESVGFRPVVCRYMNSVGFLGWWANARFFRRAQQSGAQIAVFDSLLLPLLSRIEDIVEPPVGQSLFTVLLKVGYVANG
jgi:SAM-dependent methyltransferase